MQGANRGEKDKEHGPNVERYKTQFLWHATYKPEDSNAASAGGGSFAATSNRPLFSMAAYPFYGTKYRFKSGNYYEKELNESFEPEFPIPLTYLISERNLNNKTMWTPQGPQEEYHFSQEELKEIPNDGGVSHMESYFPTFSEWQSILPYNARMDKNKAMMTYGFDEENLAFFAQYVWNHTNDDGSPNYSHIVTYRPFPKGMPGEEKKDIAYNRYVDPSTGFPYAKRTEKNDGLAYKDDVTFGTEVDEGIKDEYWSEPQFDPYKSQMATRIEYKNLGDAQNAKVVITQRYLGHHFILDPFDIDTDAYWKYLGNTGFNALTPQGDATIELPLTGYVMEDGTKTEAGYGAIYWVSSSANTGKKIDIDRWSSDPPFQDNTEPLIPLYFNLNTGSGNTTTDWWRIGNTGANKDFYDATNHTPMFKALIRPYRKVPNSYELYSRTH